MIFFGTDWIDNKSDLCDTFMYLERGNTRNWTQIQTQEAEREQFSHFKAKKTETKPWIRDLHEEEWRVLKPDVGGPTRRTNPRENKSNSPGKPKPQRHSWEKTPGLNTRGTNYPMKHRWHRKQVGKTQRQEEKSAMREDFQHKTGTKLKLETFKQQVCPGQKPQCMLEKKETKAKDIKTGQIH